MVSSEREMVRKLTGEASANREQAVPERSTSLQPTYEDSVPPDEDETLEYDD